MLASGAHVKIGTKEFRIAFSEEGAYTYSQETLEPEIQFWRLQDWSGGEGNDVFDPDDPTVYHQGNTNPRLPGILTSPPIRGDDSFGSSSLFAHTVVSGSQVWVIGGTVQASSSTYYRSSDFETWDDEVDSGWNAAVEQITAVCSDGTNIFLAGFDSATNDFQIRAVAASTTAKTISAIRSFGDSNTAPIIGMGVLGDFLYYWNGQKLRYRKIANGTGATEHDLRSFSFGLGDLTWRTDYWGGMVQGDGSLYFFTSTESFTKVFEVTKKQKATEIWTLPTGFTAKSMAWQAGALILVGDYLGTSGFYVLSTVTRQTSFNFVRLGSTVDLEIAGPGYGQEVILSEANMGSAGKIFVYNIAFDQLSQLDEVTHTSGVVGGAGVFKENRYIALTDGSDLNVYYWDVDESPSTTVTGRAESGVTDMGNPQDEKQLDGFHVLSDANSTKTATVYYQDNEDETWTSAGTATTGFHNYLTVSNASSTVKFRTLRVRVDTTAGVRVYDVAVRYRVNTYEETWELLLDLTDESVDQTRGRRRRSDEDRGWQLRDYIRDIADDKTVVTFLDGAKYPQADGDDPDKYSTHTVVVEIPVDQVDKPGEGLMLVRLRSVSTN